MIPTQAEAAIKAEAEAATAAAAAAAATIVAFAAAAAARGRRHLSATFASAASGDPLAHRQARVILPPKTLYPKQPVLWILDRTVTLGARTEPTSLRKCPRCSSKVHWGGGRV